MTRRITLLVLLVFAFALIGTNGDHSEGSPTSTNPVVTTPLGKIKGATLTSRLSKTINAFRGIRYAKPPVDELRFKPPVPVEKWEGELDATKDGSFCPQPGLRPVSEDCLIVNVYSTKLPTSSENPKRPVIVHILPGGFYSVGSMSYLAGPQYFMDQDIVLVTFNYRLATLGFLSTGDKEAPGNNGLKDQVLLLKWVKQNIAAFGGDPDNVTILGYSAGARSVILHMVSPMSEGLFHRGISMSGSALGAWSYPTNQLNIAKKQARFVGCPEDTSANIINCLKTVSAEVLGNTFFQFKEFGTDPVLIWSPVIEPNFGQESFLPEHPISLIQKGQFRKVPFITGITTDEFGYYATDLVQNQTLIDEFNSHFEDIAPISFLYERGTENSKKISKELRKFYLDDKPISKSQLSSLPQLYADSTVGFGVHRSATLISQYSDAPVYYYRFSYQGRYSHIYLRGTNNTVPYGVTHHDDLIYLFYISRLFPEFKPDDPEVEMVEKLTTLWANFARTGKPIPEPTEKLDNVEWVPYTVKDQKYLDIGNKLVIHEKLYTNRYDVWEKLFPLSQYCTENSGKH